jgi:hypothetical protein
MVGRKKITPNNLVAMGSRAALRSECDHLLSFGDSPGIVGVRRLWCMKTACPTTRAALTQVPELDVPVRLTLFRCCSDLWPHEGLVRTVVQLRIRVTVVDWMHHGSDILGVDKHHGGVQHPCP